LMARVGCEEGSVYSQGQRTKFCHKMGEWSLLNYCLLLDHVCFNLF
jgi:hypothetical protein